MVVCPDLLSLGVHVWPSPSSTSSLVHQTPLLPLWCGRLPCQIEIFTGCIFQVLTLFCRQPYGWLAQSLLFRSLASCFFLPFALELLLNTFMLFRPWAGHFIQSSICPPTHPSNQCSTVYSLIKLSLCICNDLCARRWLYRLQQEELSVGTGLRCVQNTRWLTSLNYKY